MKFKALLDKSAELLNIVLKSPAPADRNVSDFFREKRAIGSKERKFISELIFFTLRNKIALEDAASALLGRLNNAVDSSPADKKLFLQLILLSASFISIKSMLPSSFNAAELYAKIDKEEDILIALHDYAYSVFNLTAQDLNNWNAEVESGRKEDLAKLYEGTPGDPAALVERLFSLPAELYGMLAGGRSANQIAGLAEFFTGPAQVSLRVNLSKASRPEVAEALAAEGFRTELSKYSQAGLIALQRGQITQSEPFLAGKVEVQEIGSQLISLALAPKPGESVFDACCGAGGKSLHIADIQGDRGYILANDIEPIKLRRLSQRAARCGFTSIRTHLTKRGAKSSNLPPNIKSFDKILIDAPCSGSGTLRREPMRKYRLTRKLVDKLAEAQLAILADYARYLSVGGELLYATCSIFEQENRGVVNKFLASNPSYAPEPLLRSLSESGIELPGLGENDFDFAVDPVELKSDGFYFAKIKRISR